MFPMNLLRRLGHDKVSTKDEASRTRRVRARRNLGGLETLEERQLLASQAYMLVGDGTVVHGGATGPAAPKGSFELFTFGWDVPNPPALGANPKAGAGGATVTKFTITKAVGPASAALLSAQLTGRSFKSAEVVIVLNAGGSAKVVEYNFTKVVVTSYELSPQGPSGGRPKESDTFAFSTVQVENQTLTLRGKQGRLYSTGRGFALNQPNELVYAP
jgi:type VI protein secretion system component Hcp